MITSGKRIRELRIHRKKSQQELANELGYKTYTTISKWEADKALPPANDLKKLALYFEVSTDYLLGLKDSPAYFSTEDVHNTVKVKNIGALNMNYKDKILSPFEKEAIPHTEVPQYILEEDPDKYFVAEVRTDSFNRRINSGDNVVVLDATKIENLHLESGNILIIKIEDNYRILLFKKTDSMIYLEPFSYLSGFESLTYSKEQFEQLEVVGKIVYVFRKFD